MKATSISTLLIKYDEKRDRFLQNLNTVENLTLEDLDYMSKDTKCMLNMGKGTSGTYVERKAFSCGPCSNLSRIVDLTRSHINEDITLPVGSEKKIMRIGAFQPQDFYLEKCGPKLYRLDKFTNKLINTMVVNKIQEDHELSVIPKVYDSFICGKQLFLLHEMPNMDQLKFETVKDLKSCIFQFVAFLDLLKKVRYSHGDSTVRKFKISKQSRESNKFYKGKKVKSSVSLKFFPSKFCSLEVENGNRLFHFDHKINEDLYLLNMYDTKDTDTFFTLPEHYKFEDYLQAKCLGLYPYLSSIDLYVFMVSLYGKIKKDPIDLWSVMFDDLSFPDFDSGLKMSSEKEVYSFLVGKKLKKDLCSAVLNTF